LIVGDLTAWLAAAIPSMLAYAGGMRWAVWGVAILLLLGGVVAWGMMSPAPPPCRGFCVLVDPPHRLHTHLALILWAGGLVSLGAAVRFTPRRRG
jgi:hypothetical protein